ncbi:MAG: hypothetical protein JXO22_16340 [Phycisphaerae bacterium]|nr:hypothetical protein [Phycisphaerae bacterium]
MRKVQLGIVVLALLVAPALAQDSVSKNLGGLPGDALNPYNDATALNGSEQCADYVVDLVPFTTSWETEFAIAPIVKSSKVTGEYFNALISAQSMSRLHAQNVMPPVPTYGEWVSAPGFGVHPTENLPPAPLAAPASTNQFGVVFAEFESLWNGAIGAVVNYDPDASNRLFVHRVVAAGNGHNAAEERSTINIGAVDEFGNVMLRSDDYSLTGPNPITNDNIFGVPMLGRNCAVRNVIDASGASDVGTWIVQSSATAHSTPNIGPAGVFGVPYYIGVNYNSQYIYGATNPPAGTLTHLATTPLVTSTRGTLSYMTKNHPCLGGTHGTLGILGYSTDICDTMNLWAVDAAGNVVAGSPTALVLPLVVTDFTDGVTNTGTLNEFDHYHSQVGFNGGNGQIALNIDQAGHLMAAAVVYQPVQAMNNPANYIAMARISPSCAVDWSIVAYSSNLAIGAWETGKPILDGPGGNMIGRLTHMDQVTGGSPGGPSMSAPMIDSVGNVWFIAAVALYKTDLQGQPWTDYDSALIRAVYTPNWQGGPNPGWELELVLELGSTFVGANSGLPWQISFMGIADSNSVSSGTAWSSNICEKAYRGLDPAPDLETADPTSLGGLVISTEITYDIDGDNRFNDPTSSNYDPAYPADEGYNVLLYIAPNQQAGEPYLCGDADCDGSVDVFDIDAFVMAITSLPTYNALYGCANNCDTNCDNAVDVFDIDTFVGAITGAACDCSQY